MQGGDHPVLGTALAHRHVEDAHLAGAVVHGHDAVEELGEHESFDGALRERTDVEQARRNDRAGLNGGHTGERQEDALARADLDDQRVENTGASKLSDVHAATFGADLNRCNAHSIILG